MLCNSSVRTLKWDWMQNVSKKFKIHEDFCVICKICRKCGFREGWWWSEVGNNIAVTCNMIWAQDKEQLRRRKWIQLMKKWWQHCYTATTVDQRAGEATQDYSGKRSRERIWKAGFRYSCRRMEVATHDRARCRQLVSGLCCTGSDKA